MKFPAELCNLLPGQKPKEETEHHQAALIRAAAENAPTRLNEIQRFVNNETLYPKENEEFGLRLNRKPLDAEGRVLPTPQMIGGDGTEIKIRDGGWRSGKFFKASKLNYWITIVIEDTRNRMRDSEYNNFVQEFKRTGNQLGKQYYNFTTDSRTVTPRTVTISRTVTPRTVTISRTVTLFWDFFYFPGLLHSRTVTLYQQNIFSVDFLIFDLLYFRDFIFFLRSKFSRNTLAGRCELM